jgi:hypothetical protein
VGHLAFAQYRMALERIRGPQPRLSHSFSLWSGLKSLSVEGARVWCTVAREVLSGCRHNAWRELSQGEYNLLKSTGLCR